MVAEGNPNHATTTTTTITTLKQRRNTVPPTTVLIPHDKHKPSLNHTPPPPLTTNGNHRSPSSFPSIDYDLFILKSPPSPSDSYTSLRDILPSTPASVLSPSPVISLAGVSSSSSGSGYEISIRNRLVKQAAWAYLQPALLSSSPSSSSRHLCFFSGDHLRQLFHDLWQLASETFARAYDCLVDALWLFLCR